MNEKDFKRLKRGDEVKVVDSTCDHGFEIGEVVELVYHSEFEWSNDALFVNDNGFEWWLDQDDVEKYNAKLSK